MRHFFLTSHSSATRHQWLNLFSTRHECFTSDVGLTRTRLVSCILLTSLIGNVRNETSQIPVTGPGRCLALGLVSIRPGQGTRPDESKASDSHARSSQIPAKFRLFFLAASDFGQRRLRTAW